MKTFDQLKEFLSNIPCIHYGGCGIATLAMYKFLRNNGEDCNIAYLQFQITVESNCRNAKVTITASSDSIKKREIACQVSTKSGYYSFDLVYKSQSFTDFESVIKFANTIVKANEGKRFWLFVVEKLQNKQKELLEQVHNTYGFFDYQAQEVCKNEAFGSYYSKNKSRFYDGVRCISQSNSITIWIVQILSGITK